MEGMICNTIGLDECMYPGGVGDRCNEDKDCGSITTEEDGVTTEQNLICYLIGINECRVPSASINLLDV